MSLQLDTLKTARDPLKASLRALEIEQRQAEGVIKKLRQREIRTKREIDALSTLVEMQEQDGQEAEKPAAASDAAAPASP